MSKKTVVIGASTKPERYSYQATMRLKRAGHQVIPLGIKEGVIDGEVILTNKPQINETDTVTLYIGLKNQPEWYNYILNLKPKRLIFNPGTENPELFKMASEKNIECLEACTLVMLSIGNY